MSARRSAGTVIPGKSGTVATIAARVPSADMATLPLIPSGSPNG
jgi:hypothetical protein